ncbi:NAD-dependent succinate-semialdehyde dehydrogenase [Caballeronia humi]|uniref:Succinate-semialdehyde dehydrogenase n=1 Tax=Caballeronia humi TaxID=326474 RepID=A0A158IFG8_9BURK|nr:NAD-dependent succinate-semialdehyde dehydrogenase [Caballeronia humi]SAL55123.1 succinate-semialdehyde dehydrogenase [Caballeronia humi]
MQLKCANLFEQSAYVGGTWIEATSQPNDTVVNPANGEAVGRVPRLTAAQANDAVSHAATAFDEWREWSGRERACVLREWAQLVKAHRDDLAIILSSEQGKPIHEARAEIAQAANYIEWFSEESRRIYGDNMPAARRSQRVHVIRQPVGVCAAITSWTFPSSMVARKIGAALAAGCTVVLKPSSEAPFSALALCVLAENAGLPRGVFSVLTGDDDTLVQALVDSPQVRKVSFTGSIETGKQLMARCANTVKKVSLELGASSPFIVFDDADLDLAVSGAVAARFRHTGQAAMCANRFLIQDSVHDEFVRRLAGKVKALKVGDGMRDDSQVGPLIDGAALARIEAMVAQAVSAGAKVVAGGQRHPAGPNFYQPTVLTDVDPSMDICGDEILGPVASVMRFSDEAEALRLANQPRTGLAAYFYTSDLNRSFRVVEALECGVVGVNETLVFNEVAPFGGVKESGMGREGSHYGVDEYLDTKYVCIGNVG